jgi:hypothetical protein
MNEHLVKLVAFWSAWLISPRGRVTVTVGIKNKLLGLLEQVATSYPEVAELRQIALSMCDQEELHSDHPINKAMLAFILEHESELPLEFKENVNNIRRFFSKSDVGQ